MKNKHYTLLALLLPMFAFSQEAKISADVRGRDCKGGTGLCSVTGGNDNREATEITAKKISEQSVAFIFQTDTLSNSVQKGIAGKEFAKILAEEKPQFVQEKDIILEEELLNKLGIAIKYNLIKQGNYPLMIENKQAVVVFTLAEK